MVCSSTPAVSNPTSKHVAADASVLHSSFGSEHTLSDSLHQNGAKLESATKSTLVLMQKLTNQAMLVSIEV